MEFLTRGAEAELYLSYFFGRKVVIKRRVQKKYRIKQIDVLLRKRRTILEARLLFHAKKAKVLCPVVYEVNGFELTMGFVDGVLLRDVKEIPSSLMKEIGANLAHLHHIHIIHGDFTTANIIVKEKKPYFIDFGLGAFSKDIEDKAVDVLLMKKALRNNKLFHSFVNGYLVNEEAESILKRVGEIEKRGRYIIR